MFPVVPRACPHLLEHLREVADGAQLHLRRLQALRVHLRDRARSHAPALREMLADGLPDVLRQELRDDDALVVLALRALRAIFYRILNRTVQQIFTDFRQLVRARSRLYRSRFWQPITSTYFAAFFEIYKIIIPLHRSKFKSLANVHRKRLLSPKIASKFARNDEIRWKNCKIKSNN